MLSNEYGHYAIERVYGCVEDATSSLERFSARGAYSVSVDAVRDYFVMTAWFSCSEVALCACDLECKGGA